MNDDSRWHLDKRIPISLIIAIIAQTFTFGWFANDGFSRIRALEKWQENRPDFLPSDTATRLYRIENNQNNLIKTMDKLEDVLRRLDERLRLREQGP